MNAKQKAAGLAVAAAAAIKLASSAHPDRSTAHSRTLQMGFCIGNCIVLDVDLLLGPVLSGDQTMLCWFTYEGEPKGMNVRGIRGQLRRLARTHLDLAACVSSYGLHLRWRGGRGGLNFRAKVPGKTDRVLQLGLVAPAAQDEANAA